MRADEIRKMDRDEIVKQLTQLYSELRNIHDSIRIGKEKDSSKSLKIKRNIARMLTVLKQMPEVSKEVKAAKKVKSKSKRVKK